MRQLIFCKKFNIKFTDDSYCNEYRYDQTKYIAGLSTLRMCKNCVNSEYQGTEILH